MQTTTTRHDITEALDDVITESEVAKLDAIEGEHYEALGHIIEARKAAEYAEWCAVARWKQNGASWADIGAMYGVTRSAAQQRFGSE